MVTRRGAGATAYRGRCDGSEERVGRIHTDAATTLDFVAPPTTTAANTIITPGVTIVLRHEQRLLH